MATPVTIVDAFGVPVTLVEVNGQPVDLANVVQTVNGHPGPAVTVTAADVGAVPASTVGQAGGVASLDGSGKIPQSELPPLDHEVGQAANQAAMLALAVNAPAVCIRTDFTPAHVFYLTADPASTLANWVDTGEFGAGGANPTAQVGTAAINGVAATFMRSDAAPAINQAIAPTWTGPHKFTAVSNNTDSTVTVRSTTPRLEFSRPDQPDRLVFEYESSETLKATYTNAAGDPVLSPFLINPAVVAVVDCFFKAENESAATDSTATIVANAPQLDIQKENGAADAKRWLIDGGTANNLLFKATNDAGTTSSNFLEVVRGGASVTSVTFGNTTSNPTFLWAGTGPWTVGGGTGNPGEVLTSTGNATAPAWTAAPFPKVVGGASATAQSANVNTPNFYAVAVGGMYRVSTFIVITRAATTSATMPSVNVGYTEAASGANVQDIVSLSSVANTVGSHSGGTAVIQCQQGSNISYSTSNYASSGATSMQYRVDVLVERLT